MAKTFSTVLTGNGNVVCESCLIAKSPWLRMKGLLGRADLPHGEGILLSPASSIHMAFMRFPIDAVFCDRELVVIDVVRGLRPWRLAGRRGAKVVVELAEGAATAVEAGDRLSLGTIEP